MLCKIVNEIINASSPVDEELTLLDVVMYPLKIHVNGIVAYLLHGFIGNSKNSIVVCFERCGPLRVAHIKVVQSGTPSCTL
jgi:hypothetical protein